MLNTGVPSRSKSFREKARERFGLSRNKSRSVDVQRPSTLSSLRSKIQTVSATFKDTVSVRDDEAGEACEEVQPRKGRSSRIKVPTTSYTVRPSDTVFSIAAQFNVTPAEVKTLNRLSHSSELFPDQVIRVPDLDALAELEREKREREAEEAEEEERQRQLQAANSLATSPRAGPGIAARVTPSSSTSVTSSLHASLSLEEAPPLSAEESVRERQFVKSEHARLITDGEGCVSGTLIITPQTLMFDPSVHDRLVQERGQSYFQWQIELRQVRTVAVYSDPRAMRLMVGDSARIDNPDLSEAEMRMELNEEAHRFVETKPGPAAASNGEQAAATEVAEEVGKEEEESPKVEKKEEERDGKEEKEEEEEKEAKKEEEEKETKEEKDEEKEEEKTEEKEEEKEEKKKEDKEEEREEKEDNEKEDISEAAETGSEDKSKSFDLRSPQSSGSPLDYLCILYNPLAPARRAFPFLSASPKAEEPRLPDRGQHWFTLPHEKNKELLAFLKDSRPEELDGPSAAVSPSASAVTAAVSGGIAAAAAAASSSESFFVLQEKQLGRTPPKDDPHAHRLHAIRQQSLDWELINREEVYGATCANASLVSGMSIDEELLIPELIGEARVLQEWMLKDLVANLPSRAEGCLKMELAYSTHVHGFSLNSLYRKCRRETEDKPCVLLIRSQKCSSDACFGAVLSSHLRVSEHFYGTGETYLLRWNPSFERFSWSGNNNYIIKGGNKSIMIGSSSGAVALFIDEGLYRGRSQLCDTFLHPAPLTPDGEEDFVIENLEVWDFK